jgi:hypothetical protein
MTMTCSILQAASNPDWARRLQSIGSACRVAALGPLIVFA